MCIIGLKKITNNNNNNNNNTRTGSTIEEKNVKKTLPLQIPMFLEGGVVEGVVWLEQNAPGAFSLLSSTLWCTLTHHTHTPASKHSHDKTNNILTLFTETFINQDAVQKYNLRNEDKL